MSDVKISEAAYVLLSNLVKRSVNETDDRVRNYTSHDVVFSDLVDELVDAKLLRATRPDKGAGETTARVLVEDEGLRLVLRLPREQVVQQEREGGEVTEEVTETEVQAIEAEVQRQKEKMQEVFTHFLADPTSGLPAVEYGADDYRCSFIRLREAREEARIAEENAKAPERVKVLESALLKIIQIQEENGLPNSATATVAAEAYREAFGVYPNDGQTTRETIRNASAEVDENHPAFDKGWKKGKERGYSEGLAKGRDSMFEYMRRYACREFADSEVVLEFVNTFRPLKDSGIAPPV